MQPLTKLHNQALVSMYRWLSRELMTTKLVSLYTTVEYHINESSLGKIGYEEAVTTNREIVENYLAYTHLYMFLVAELRYGKK